ncbi:branched-chain amino acid transport system ATP-binding protein [Bradyrhizobium sp. LA6.1]|uniref:ABC transporter ATP-binding protein n=1 Tax=Bradyrhizobium sp. LA6.1 TaxID=3156378 RepID=UPI00339235FE
MLEVDNLSVTYGRIRALKGVSLRVDRGTVVSLIGANGAGKTTLLRAISGVLPIEQGSIRFEGKPIERLKSHRRVAMGIAHSPEGRQIFKSLSVEDNLRLGAYRRNSGAIEKAILDIYETFPILWERREQMAGNLSGGQQQMLAIGRALLSAPKLLLLDEPSLGLAPLIVEQIFAVLDRLKSAGIIILLVEQNASLALAHSDYGYVLETGHVVHAAGSEQLREDPKVQEAYLGI